MTFETFAVGVGQGDRKRPKGIADGQDGEPYVAKLRTDGIRGPEGRSEQICVCAGCRVSFD